MTQVHRYVFYTKIAHIGEKRHDEWVSGRQTKSVSDGYWITTEGPSPQSIKVSDDAIPPNKVGQQIKVTWEIEDA